MQPVPATVPERLSISAAACSDAAEITYMTPLASLVPSDRHISPRLAVDAIAKSRQMRANSKKGNQTEEYFGSSDSD